MWKLRITFFKSDSTFWKGVYLKKKKKIYISPREDSQVDQELPANVLGPIFRDAFILPWPLQQD